MTAQIRETDGTVNSAASEPAERKGRDLRPACCGCGRLHMQPTDELRCLRAIVTALRRDSVDALVEARVSDRLELFRGKGMCIVACCQGKATVCVRHAGR